jgi:hypothetical protein
MSLFDETWNCYCIEFAQTFLSFLQMLVFFNNAIPKFCKLKSVMFFIYLRSHVSLEKEKKKQTNKVRWEFIAQESANMLFFFFRSIQTYYCVMS